LTVFALASVKNKDPHFHRALKNFMHSADTPNRTLKLRLKKVTSDAKQHSCVATFVKKTTISNYFHTEFVTQNWYRQVFCI
jgi:hypothetical protein